MGQTAPTPISAVGFALALAGGLPLAWGQTPEPVEPDVSTDGVPPSADESSSA